MGVSRYPCRVCGRATWGEDRYVVCEGCLTDLEVSPARPAPAERGEAAGMPLSPDEVEARLRRLLDGW
jgi:hypothetical protein